MSVRSLCYVACAVALISAGAVAQTPPSGRAAAGGAEQLPAKLGRHERLTLVIHTAEDCPVCKAWREAPSGLPVAQQLAHRWPLLQVVFIERQKLNGSESESLYPTEYQFMYAARRERYQLSPPVPLFEIVRGQQLLARQAGLQAWSESIVPAVRLLEGNREPPEGN
jgi:hypothetical protein